VPRPLFGRKWVPAGVGREAGGVARDEDEEEAIRIDVPADLAALEGVRHRVVDAARQWGFDDLDELALIVSEMVTNAILHAETPSVVTCRPLDAHGIELAVTDRGGGLPTMGPLADDRGTSGRGLRIVDALAASWGVEHDPDGSKTIWARFGAPGRDVLP
jgi:anti-sigma regulatory factor (Ser/Thr protein kinase)